MLPHSAIFGLCVILGYTSDQLLKLSTNLEMETLLNINLEDITNILENFGIDSGFQLMKILKTLCSYKLKNKDPSFEELYEKSKIKLIVTATNLRTKKYLKSVKILLVIIAAVWSILVLFL